MLKYIFAISLFVNVTQEKLLDYIVAVVDQKILMQSDVLIDARILMVLSGQVQADNVISTDLTDAYIKSVSRYVVDQIVILHYLNIFSDTRASNEKVQEKLEQFKDLFSNIQSYDSFLKTFQISETKLTHILSRNLRVEEYLLKKIKDFDKKASNPLEKKELLKKWLEYLRSRIDIKFFKEEL